MWFDADIINEEENNIIDDGGGSDCDSGVNDNISDINTISDIEDNLEPVDMEVINYVYNNQQQQLEYHQLHHLHPIIEADDETASIDSGADFSENKLELLDADVCNVEDCNDIDSIIADPTIRVAGIANDWINFDDKNKKYNITYKIEPFISEYGNIFTNKLEYMLHVVIPKLHQHADSDIFAKLKPQRINPNFKGSLERYLSLEVIEQRILHCFYSDYGHCLNDFEMLLFFNTFPKEIYNFEHKDSIGIFFRKLLHRLPHEEIELPPPQYKSSISSSTTSPTITCRRRKRKLSFSSSINDDEATASKKKRALIISTNDLLNRFKAFSPSAN
uniref:Uncharacterized protein n=1 Tax=Panagrolaimus superbus TaxID=310955 RepID=A0A914XTP1_9BILA